MIIISMVFLWLIYLGIIVIGIKGENTSHNRLIIIHAIAEYYSRYVYIDSDQNIADSELYDAMEPYERTLWRLNDWSYKNILPPDKYELIKPFIRKE